MKGWVALHRCVTQKAIWQKSTPEQKVILVTLMTMANHEENEWDWQGEKFKVKPGQFITSLDSIVKECGRGISLQNVRSALKRFEKLQFLTNKSTKTGRLITLVNWDLYQIELVRANKEDGKEVTKRSQTGNKEVTPNNNDKNDKHDNKEYIYTIFEHWNTKQIIIHKKLTDKIKRKISGTLKDYSLDEITKTIDHYSEILKNDKYYWTHKWTLEELLQRGMEKFLHDDCFNNFLKEKGGHNEHIPAKTPGTKKESKYKYAYDTRNQ